MKTIDLTEENEYWRSHYTDEPYYEEGYHYEDYEGAYRVGYEGFERLGESGKGFEECEAELRRDYERNYPQARLTWDKARRAARAAWHRVDRRLEHYLDYDVVDRNASKVGTLECIWSDHLNEPAFIGVHTGWVFGKTHVVPAQQVEVNEFGRKVRLPYDAQKVKDAPSYDADAEMTREKEEEVYRYYGVTTTAGEPAQHTPGHPEPGRTSRATPEKATIQLSEEELKIGKRKVEVGGVRLRKVVRTEVVNQPVEVQREELVIERVPAEEAHTGRQKPFTEQEIYIPLRREEVIVQKEARLREEVRARKKTQTEREEIREQVRKEDIEVEERGQTRARGPRQPTPAEGMREREKQPRSMRRHKP